MNPLLRSHHFDRSHAASSLMLAAQLLAVLLLCMASAMAQAEPNSAASKDSSQTAQHETVLPAAGQSVERELAGNQAHSYQVKLQAGEFLRVIVAQHGIDVVVMLFNPRGERVIVNDSGFGVNTQGNESLSMVAEGTGVYRLEISPWLKKAPAGRYEVKVTDLRAATENEKRAAKGDKKEEQKQPSKPINAEEIKKTLEGMSIYIAELKAKGDRQGQTKALGVIALTYLTVGELQKAYESIDQGILLCRQIGDKNMEVNMLFLGALASFVAGDKQKVFNYLEELFQIQESVGDVKGELVALFFGSFASFLQGDHQKSLEYINRSIPLLQESTYGEIIFGTEGYTYNEKEALGFLAINYFLLGEHRKALDIYNRILSILRVEANRTDISARSKNAGPATESRILSEIGSCYSKLGQHQKALDLYSQALRLSVAEKNIEREIIALDGIGAAYRDLGDPKKALAHLNQSLELSRKSSNSATQGKSDSGIRTPTNIEARILSDLMLTCRALKKPDLAIFFGKQAVNIIQGQRSNIKELAKDLPTAAQQQFGVIKNVQQFYVKISSDTYRALADILISEGRLPEAQQVLGMLKEDEYFDFVRRDPTASPATARASLTAEEAKLEEEYRKLADEVTLIGKQRGELFAKNERTDEEERLLAQIDEQLSVASDHFQKFLEQLQVRLNPNTAKGARVDEVKDALGMKKTLRELGHGTVLLYTLVGADKYRVMLVTPDSEQAYENPISAVDLQRKVLAFREALQDPNANPAPLAQELYRILVGPKLAHDLEQAGATTLMWSLDGVLRYLPISALHDGRKYLVESYRSVIFTPASRDRLKDPVSPHWKALGLGVSQRRQLDLNGQKVAFNPLPGVPKELRSIIRDTSSAEAANSGDGVLAGRVILDESFTKEAMKTALRQRYQLVHIASHFVFQPGNETTSFLLLGDSDPRNDRLTLEEVKNVSFEGVDLLTLSACETALGGKQANGVEVESFGVLAQRQGAEAVLATLWPVADQSTSQLMREFYRVREANSGITKAEALQRAQVALLRGTIQSQSGAAKVTDEGWRHPYYWAPFILIGNWR